jgi:hypothetical protein
MESTIMPQTLPMHDPRVIRGANRVRFWREGGFNPYLLESLCRDLDVRQWLRSTGWAGSDGSSCSFDDVQGVQIGMTGGRMNRLPATLHDVSYELIRRLNPPGRVREFADAMYRDTIIQLLRDRLVDGSLSCRVGILQAHVRYLGLRAFGWRAARGR